MILAIMYVGIMLYFIDDTLGEIRDELKKMNGEK